MTEHETEVFIEADGTKRVITGYRKPDLMVFKDASGEEHRIFMDLGTHKTAYQLFMDENWEELKKFPKHGTHFLHSLHMLNIC